MNFFEFQFSIQLKLFNPHCKSGLLVKFIDF